jgi:hypothetical protein
MGIEHEYRQEQGGRSRGAISQRDPQLVPTQTRKPFAIEVGAQPITSDRNIDSGTEEFGCNDPNRACYSYCDGALADGKPRTYPEKGRRNNTACRPTIMFLRNALLCAGFDCGRDTHAIR